MLSRGGRQGREAAEAGGQRLQPLPQEIRPASPLLGSGHQLQAVRLSWLSCCDCWFTGEFLSLPWYLFLLDVFYLDSRGVIVVARWECARGLASGF